MSPLNTVRKENLGGEVRTEEEVGARFQFGMHMLFITALVAGLCSLSSKKKKRKRKRKEGKKGRKRKKERRKERRLIDFMNGRLLISFPTNLGQGKVTLGSLKK